MTALSEIKTLALTALATLATVELGGNHGAVLAGLIGGLSALHSQRANELLERTLNRLDVEKIDKAFLESEAFLEIFQRSVEIVTRTASAEKRRLVAQYLSGVIETSVIDDIHSQLLEDLNDLQEFHLQVIAALPDKAGEIIKVSSPPEKIQTMEKYIYRKATSDLERLGFLIYMNRWASDDGEYTRDTTEYLVKFKETFK